MLLSTGVLADTTFYVGDEVKIPMRSKDVIAKNNIIDHLNINTPVTLIKKQENGWSQIKHGDNQGWMISRYLTANKPQNTLATKLQSKLNLAEKINANRQQVEAELKQQISTHENEISRLNTEILNNNTQSLELNKIQNKLLNLDESNADLNDQVLQLKTANSSMHGTDFLTLVSAITLFLGSAIGMGISRASANRNNKMYTL
jgi:SH3 domain protein